MMGDMTAATEPFKIRRVIIARIIVSMMRQLRGRVASFTDGQMGRHTSSSRVHGLTAGRLTTKGIVIAGTWRRWMRHVPTGHGTIPLSATRFTRLQSKRGPALLTDTHSPNNRATHGRG